MNMFQGIGICGPAASGKTTLAVEIEKRTHAVIVHVDDYFFTDKEHLVLYKNDIREFERCENIDWNACFQTVYSLLQGNKTVAPKMNWQEKTTSTHVLFPAPLVVVEGFLLFQHLPLCTMLRRLYYIDVPVDVGIERMSKREGKDVSEFAKTIVYSAYKQHRDSFLSMADVVFSADSTTEEQVVRVLSDVGL